MFLLWLVGVLLSPVLSQTASSTLSPHLPSSKRVILWCSWCKSPAQTTQACRRFLRSLFTVFLSQVSLSQGSGSHPHSKRPLILLWMGPEHLHYAPGKVITYITVRWGGPYACFILLGFQGVLPERKVRKEYFCKMSDVYSFAHLLLLWWTQPLSFRDLSPALSLFFLSVSPIWKRNLHISYFRALISFLFIWFFFWCASSCKSLHTAGG